MLRSSQQPGSRLALAVLLLPEVLPVALQDAAGALAHVQAIPQHQARQLAPLAPGLLLVLHMQVVHED